eukprot:CAMPEP_0175038888 /NCGR_PEP_ID=MMETSP0052_2-20121109/168_1 /TAXON_ID=51329 ORGANISM="Polytomella parva, Strain SAG 63-3" /NCGR_SAMPLE_ID=MMETSP0052_2 /ASSEMBLY_ACC=CAM_ASM_000194 /LENGTH=191 /DNA_ID=CAMNT_0016300459 /DNA_START=35 /DNA_END=610 /DNA_ORIENTATION=-
MNEMSENKGVKEVTEVKKGKRQESSGERWLIAAGDGHERNERKQGSEGGDGSEEGKEARKQWGEVVDSSSGSSTNTSNKISISNKNSTKELTTHQSSYHDRSQPTSAEDDVAMRLREMLQQDTAFLHWVESGAGKAHVAGQLKALRCRAAAGMISKVLQSSEGKDGMMRALRSAMKQDPMLSLQLRMMLKE